MARTAGSRNLNYDARRRELLLLARNRLTQLGGSRASFREMAEACGVSVPTLRHYFTRREDLIRAVMSEDLSAGRLHLEHVSTPAGSFAASVREALAYIAMGFSHGVGEVHTVGLTEGLRHDDLGPAFVDLVLEPSIAAVRRRLDAHVNDGEMRNVDTRHAALVLLAPVVLLMLHQRELGGVKRYPIELDSFLDDHAASFVRGHATLIDGGPAEGRHLAADRS